MCCWHWTFFLPCIPPSYHPLSPSLSPSFFIPAWLRVCVRRAYHWFSQDPWEKCRSAVQCEGLFGYQTSSSNLHGVNLNIAVSCRLPHSSERARESKKTQEYSYRAFKSITLSGGAWPYIPLSKTTPEQQTCGWEKVSSLSKLAHVRVRPHCLEISSFSRFTRHIWVLFLDQDEAAKAGFPMHGFICCSPTTNRFPQLIYYWRLLCCLQNFPLVDYVSCLLSCTTNTNILCVKTETKHWTQT